MAIKHSTMTLYSDQLDPMSHVVRIVLAEKGITANIIYVDGKEPNPKLASVNPHKIVPTLVDRELILYQTSIITEYLDERFPHPPLLPVYPVARAKCRLVIYRMKQDWLGLLKQLSESATHLAAKRTFEKQLLEISVLFTEAQYFLSDEFTLADCYLAALLWRMKYFGVKVPTGAKPVAEYMARVFGRESFRRSLTNKEQELTE